MKKVFVNNKFLANLSLADKATFVLEPHMILSSYARDYFIEHQINVVEKQDSCSEQDLREEIRVILRDEYKMPSQAIEIVVSRVMEKIN